MPYYLECKYCYGTITLETLDPSDDDTFYDTFGNPYHPDCAKERVKEAMQRFIDDEASNEDLLFIDKYVREL